MFFLANPLRYVPIQSTGTVITMQDVSSGMGIQKITVPVLSSQPKTLVPVW
jgi:hypothetical protein